ncbi:MAG: right-handed parallel beta-helix repeat-containing protein [Thermoplasmata archaeon]|nr:MAG: right-handed parallel beta-helix repeat-containing protein [Thermoplasmata archaeon]
MNSNLKRRHKVILLKRSSVIVSVLFIISITMFIVPDENLIPTSSGATIYVPNDYPTIQDAINAAKGGDTVYVYSGTYYENVLVNKTVNLTGENKEFTIIKGGGAGEAVYVNANWVNITGFTITGDDPNVDGLIIDSDNNTIADNKFSTSKIGIYIWKSSGITVLNNIMSDNGIYIEGDSLEHWNTHNIDISNTVNDKPIHYWKNQIEGIVPSDAGQVILANCTNVIVEAQIINTVTVGILSGFSSNNNIITNSVFSCKYLYGIELYYSSGNNIISNFIDSNPSYALYLHYSNGNNITNNTFTNNGADSIRLINSHGNNITENFISSPIGGDGIHLENSDGNHIIGNNVSTSAIGIRLSYSSNNTLENNTCDWCFHGISLTSFSLKNTVRNNHLHWNAIFGIYMIVANGTTVVGNNISHSGRDGIHVYGAQHIIRDNIIFSNSDYGILFEYSHGNHLYGNKLYSNEESGIMLDHSESHTIHDNNVTNNKHGLYLFQFSDNNIITGNIISSNIYDGILLEYSSNNKITGNDISDNLEGINVSSSDGNIISGNNISNNTHGIRLSSALNNAITGNNVSLNNEDGIRLLSSSDWNGIIGNTVFSNSNFGIYLNDSTNNSIYHNNIIHNTNQAYDGANNANRWDDGYPSGGNYWSDFDESSEGAYDEYKGEGQDILGSDGIVDNGTIGGGGKNPYVIDSDSKDNYPLIEPNKNYMILKQGWNLISLPIIQQEKNLTKVLSSIDGLYDAVQWYDITDKKDQWKHYKVGKPYGNDLFELNEKMGIWIHITQPGDTIFFYNGTRLTENQNIALHPGWNMVGYPSLNNRDRTSALNNIDFPSDVDAIWTFNSISQRWEKMGPSDYFEIGRGYYIHSKVDKTWIVPL